MIVQYAGTGAAEGIPALFCHCGFCDSIRNGHGQVRTRSQVILDGELSIDFPPDIFAHAAAFDLPALKYVLVTHSHMDHFYAHDFILRGYKYAYGMEPLLTVFGNGEVAEVFGESVRREMKPVVAEHIRMAEIRAFEKVCFGGWRVFPLKAQHSSRDPLLFLLEKEGKRILHLTDTGGLPPETVCFLRELGGKAADLITLDCTFLYGKTEAGSRHMGLDENARVLALLEEMGLADGHTKKVITHFSHNASPTEELLHRAEEEYGVLAAYDGLILQI